MSENLDVVTHIRAAAAHERAAGAHEAKYENQMKAAGASMFAAFRAALMEQPDYRGRQINEKAILRIYESPKPRPWWDAYLVEAKFADESGRAKRDAAKRLIQWHLDPDQAARRRVQAQARVAQSRKVAQEHRVMEARGVRVRPESAAPSTAEMRSLGAAAGAGQDTGNAAEVSVEDLLGELNRLQSAAKKVEAAHRAEALEILKASARQLERYIP